MTFYTFGDLADKACDALREMESMLQREPDALSPGRDLTTSDYRLMAARNAYDEIGRRLNKVIDARKIEERVAA